MAPSSAHPGYVADFVLTAPTQDLLAPRRNPSEPPAAPPKARRRPRQKLDVAAMRPYDGHAGLLVRTALVRATTYAEAQWSPPSLRESRDIADLCRHLAYSDREYIVCLAIQDNPGQGLSAIYEVSLGSASSAQFDVEQVMKIPVLCGVGTIAIVHNHPSGYSAPSAEDVAFTTLLEQQVACLGVHLRDHVIVALEGHYSFRDAGRLAPRRR